MAAQNNLPYNVFMLYLQMLRTSNIQVSTLFDINTDWNTLNLNYRTVMVFFKELHMRFSADPFLRATLSA
jgi:hypothetical protein